MIQSVLVRLINYDICADAGIVCKVELKVAVTQGGRGVSAGKGQTWSSASEAPPPWWDGVIADHEDGNGDDYDHNYDYWLCLIVMIMRKPRFPGGR